MSAEHAPRLTFRSMGAWTVYVSRCAAAAYRHRMSYFSADDRLYYVLRYPPSASCKAIADRHDGSPRPHVSGAFVLCPMVDVSPESRPSAIVEYIAKGIKYFAGSLPLANAVRGNVSDDPRVEADFFSDRESAA